MVEYSPALLHDGIDPLELDIELSTSDRKDVYRVATGNLRYILPEVLFTGGIEPATSREYSSHQDVIDRFAEVVVERSVALMIPRDVETLRIRYADAPKLILGTAGLMQVANSSRSAASVRANVSSSELLSYVDKIIDGSIDYREWGSDPGLGIARRNPLLYMALIGQAIPPLASLRDLRAMATQQLAGILALTDIEKRSLSAMYHLDDTNATSLPEIGQIVDRDPLTVSVIVKRAIAKLTSQSAIEPRGKEGGEQLLERLPDKAPAAALRLLREATRARHIDLRSPLVEVPVEYLETLQQELRDVEVVADIIEMLGDNYQAAVRLAYTMILRYCKRSGSPVVNQTERDRDILSLFLGDVQGIYNAGIRLKKDRNKNASYVVLAAYTSAKEIEALRALHDDIPDWLFTGIATTNSRDVATGVDNYRRNLSYAMSEFAEKSALSPSMIAERCAYRPRTFKKNLIDYMHAFEGAEAHFASEAAVTPGIIRLYVRRNSANPVKAIEQWLSRRNALTKLYPVSRDTPPSVINRIAMRSPSSREDGECIDDHVRVMERYLADLQRMRDKYKAHSEVSDMTLRQAARMYPGRAEQGMRGYFKCLGTLRTTFVDDEVVDDNLLQYFAMLHMGDNTRPAVNAVHDWKRRYGLLRKQYGDTPLIDDDMIKTVATRWPKTPSMGFEIIINMRRKRMRSLQAPLSSPSFDSGSDFSYEHVLSDSGSSMTVMADLAEREAWQEQILRQLTKLDVAEQQAVLIVYGLEDMLDEEIDIQKLCSILGADDLVTYVEETAMPKLRL